MKANRAAERMSDLGNFVGDRILDLRDAVGELLSRAFAAAGRVRPSSIDIPEVGDRRRAANLVETGRKYYNDKRYHKAERCFRKAIITDESYALAHYYHGLSLFQINLPSAAKFAWTRATEVDPDSEAAEKAKSKLTKNLVYRSKSIADLSRKSNQ